MPVAKRIAKKTKINSLETFLFVPFFIIEQICIFCSKVSFISPYIETLEKMALFLLSLLVVLKILKININKKEILFAIIALLIACISYYYSGSTTLAYMVLIPYILKQSNITIIFKIDLVIKISLLILIITSYSLSLAEDCSFSRDGTIHQALGFAHPNTLGYISAIIFQEAAYLNRNAKHRVITLLSLTLLSLSVCHLSHSRTAEIVIIATSTLLLVQARKRMKPLTTTKKVVLFAIPFLLLSFSFISTALYKNDNKLAQRIDEALTGRVRLQAYYEKEYNIKLFGQKITKKKNHFQYLDNGYYKTLYYSGIVGLIVLLFIIQLSIKKSSKDKALLTILLVTLFYALSEWVVFRIATTPFWTIAFTDKKGKDEKKIPPKLA